MISPAEMKYDLPVAAKDVIHIKDLTAINSGMVLPGDLAARQRYDERLFLDNVDHQFLKDCKSEHVKIKIMRTELIQDFSAEETDFDHLARRFSIFKKDTITYYSKSPLKGRFILKIMRTELIQDFSAEETDFDHLARRFSIFKKDTITYYSKSPLKGRFILLKRRLRLFAQSRKLEALFL